MENSMVLAHETQPHRDFSSSSSPSSSSSSLRDVSYSCGSCGYELKLSSSYRNTSNIGSKYGKNIKRGVVSFLQIDESRFTLIDEFKCIPYFISKHSWGLFCHKTKLLCRKCGNHVGNAYVRTSPCPLVLDESDSATATATATATDSRKYDIRLRALQPSSSEPSAIPLLT